MRAFVPGLESLDKPRGARAGQGGQRTGDDVPLGHALPLKRVSKGASQKLLRVALLGAMGRAIQFRHPGQA